MCVCVFVCSGDWVCERACALVCFCVYVYIYMVQFTTKQCFRLEIGRKSIFKRAYHFKVRHCMSSYISQNVHRTMKKRSFSFSKSLKYKILVMGIDTDDPDFNRTNISISIAVQNFILKSKRFPDS